MLLLKVLVFEFFAVDRFAARAIACRKISSLDHETFDDSVEARAYNAEMSTQPALWSNLQTFEAQGLPCPPRPFLPCTETSEVFCSLGDNCRTKSIQRLRFWQRVQRMSRTIVVLCKGRVLEILTHDKWFTEAFYLLTSSNTIRPSFAFPICISKKTLLLATVM